MTRPINSLLYIGDPLFDDVETYGLLYARIDQRIEELEARQNAYMAKPNAAFKCTMLEQTRYYLTAWADAPYGSVRQTIRENIDAMIKTSDRLAAIPLRLAKREITKWERLAAAIS